MDNRDKLLELLTQENEMYNLHLQVCSHFLVSPDERITTAWKNRKEILSQMMTDGITKIQIKNTKNS